MKDMSECFRALELLHVDWNNGFDFYMLQNSCVVPESHYTFKLLHSVTWNSYEVITTFHVIHIFKLWLKVVIHHWK